MQIKDLTTNSTVNNDDSRVVVGLSGGVDSSVAAYLLQQQGYDVEALFMKNWEEDDKEEYCSAAVDLEDSSNICKHLNIPLHTRNFSTEYWEKVFLYFLDEYRLGRTPNPAIFQPGTMQKLFSNRAFISYIKQKIFIKIKHIFYMRLTRNNYQKPGFP
jgi:tRNA U34 2-thiouridine synthase MnmA/TrmU